MGHPSTAFSMDTLYRVGMIERLEIHKICQSFLGCLLILGLYEERLFH